MILTYIKKMIYERNELEECSFPRIVTQIPTTKKRMARITKPYTSLHHYHYIIIIIISSVSLSSYHHIIIPSIEQIALPFVERLYALVIDQELQIIQQVKEGRLNLTVYLA